MARHHMRSRALISGAAALLVASTTIGISTQASAAVGSTAFPGGIAMPTTSTAAREANAFAASGDASDAAIARTIAAQPTATWLGDWLSDSALRSTVQQELGAAARQGKTATFVTYAIPDRDCGGYSAGGLTPSQYSTWSSTLADVLKGHHAAVIVEPDALAQLPSCSSSDKTERYSLLYNSVKQLSAAGSAVYIDAGNADWQSASTMASELWNAGLQFARGFSLNVSNYDSTVDEQSYGEQLHRLTGKDYVIDTSRNGQGSNGDWCNDLAAGLGRTPAVVDDSSGLDALLWIKAPGESDGTCNGGPTAGAWYPQGAAALVRNR